MSNVKFPIALSSRPNLLQYCQESRMALGFSIIAGFCMVLVYKYSEHFCEHTEVDRRRWFIFWSMRGILIPTATWMLMNSGYLPGFSPYFSKADLVSIGDGSGILGFLAVSATAAGLVATYWAGITFAWWLFALTTESEPTHAAYLRRLLVFWGTVLLPVYALVIIKSGWPMLGIGTTLLCWPVLHHLRLVKLAAPPTPNYAMVHTKMAFGDYDAAEWEVIKELEKFEDDYRGWIMLAKLYAEEFKDLDVAHKTIVELCEQPNVTLSQCAEALNHLADWHLRIGSDPVRARFALERICKKFPGTHVDRMAKQRINSLPKSPEELAKPRKVFRLPGMQPVPKSNLSEKTATLEDPIRLAEACVEKLKKSPDDIAEREKFARLLAVDLNKPTEGIDQVSQLLEMPNQPDTKKAEWLMTMGLWHMQICHDSAAAQEIFRRVIRDFTQTPHAFEAQKRLNLLIIEERFRRVQSRM